MSSRAALCVLLASCASRPGHRDLTAVPLPEPRPPAPLLVWSPETRVLRCGEGLRITIPPAWGEVSVDETRHEATVMPSRGQALLVRGSTQAGFLDRLADAARL